MSNQDPRPLLENEDPANVRNPAVRFVEIADRATELINQFLSQNPAQGETQTKAEKDRLTAAFDALPLGDIRGAYEAAMAMEPRNNAERADRRRVRPAIEAYRQATVKANRLFERKVVGGRRKTVRRRVHRRRRTHHRK
jgi:hypothetical protein